MNVYISRDGSFQLVYVDGMIRGVFIQGDDRVIFDGLRHQVPFYEDELSSNFIKQQGAE